MLAAEYQFMAHPANVVKRKLSMLVQLQLLIFTTGPQLWVACC
jgi:hypothetical protein